MSNGLSGQKKCRRLINATNALVAGYMRFGVKKLNEEKMMLNLAKPSVELAEIISGNLLAENASEPVQHLFQFYVYRLCVKITNGEA